MGARVFIKNFEIIEDAKLVVDGLVALVGESNNGKTATYNALKVLTYNIQGRGYIRKVAGKEVLGGCKVGVLFEEEGVSVVFEKSDSPIYTLQTSMGSVVLDKAGRGGTPEDVATVLNMQALDLEGLSVNLNFIDQLSEPVLKKLSDYQMYRIAIKSFDGEKIQEAISVCRKDLDLKIKECSLKENEIEVQKKSRLGVLEQIEQFNKLEDLRGSFSVYDRHCSEYPVLESFINRRNRLFLEISNLQNSIEQLNGLDSVLSGMDCAIKASKMIVSIQGVVDRRNVLKTKIGVCSGWLVHFSDMIVLDDEYHAYIENLKELKTVIDYNNKVLSVLTEVNFKTEKLYKFGDDFTEIAEAIHLYRKNVENMTQVLFYSEKLKSITKRFGDISKTLDEVFVGLPESDMLEVLKVEKTRLELMVSTRSGIVTQIERKDDLISTLDKDILHLEHVKNGDICPECGNIYKHKSK